MTNSPSCGASPTWLAYVPHLPPPSMPPLDESVAAHLCEPTAIGWKAKVAHPSKPCGTTSALAGRACTSAGKAASAFLSMAVLQVYQAKLIQGMDESAPDLAAFKKLCSATNLALHAIKTTNQCRLSSPQSPRFQPPRCSRYSPDAKNCFATGFSIGKADGIPTGSLCEPLLPGIRAQQL